MAVLPLAKVIAGMKVTAKGWNNLVDAIQDTVVGHTHTGANSTGARVSHGDLVDAALPNTTNTHADIDVHIAGTDQVHGLPDGYQIAGVQSTSAQYVCVVGQGNVSNVAGHECWGTVTTSLTSLVSIQVTLTANWRNFCGASNQDDWWIVYTAGGTFDVHFASGNDFNPSADPGLTFFWQAWGEI